MPSLRLNRRAPHAGLLGIILALAALGIAVSVYLTIVHYDEGLLVCGLSDCHTVQASSYAELVGIPVALLGLGMYVAVLGLGLARIVRPGALIVGTVASFSLTLAGVLFAVYLTYIELFVLEAICQWCVVSAVLTTALLLCETILVQRLLAIPTDPA